MNILLDSDESLIFPHPEPYSGMLITDDDLKKFINLSVEQNKQTIIIFGANWCPDARLLEAVMQLKLIKKYLDRHSNILHIDVGDYEINTELFNVFDKNIRDGIPRIFIMDRKGRNINLQDNDTMRKARELSTQDIFDYFQKFINEAY
jgi:thiol-disulfide isomerase/thioredoxin|tara:strand:- start:153 stop:596 length:444 start_codon:yes stop_codon:yes gene_type:complete